MQLHLWKPKNRGRRSVLKELKRIWSYVHRRLVTSAYLNLCLNFNGIDQIAEGFTFKLDDRKSSKILLKLSMLQKAPKRRSPNHCKYKLKWTITVMRLQTWSKCSKIRKSKLTVFPKSCSSEYAIFPQRQPYFTYGDLQSSGLKIPATQETIHECKTCRYSDCFKMCLKPMEF